MAADHLLTSGRSQGTRGVDEAIVHVMRAGMPLRADWKCFARAGEETGGGGDLRDVAERLVRGDQSGDGTFRIDGPAPEGFDDLMNMIRGGRRVGC